MGGIRWAVLVCDFVVCFVFFSAERWVEDCSVEESVKS